MQGCDGGNRFTANPARTPAAGDWVDPESRARLAPDRLIAALADRTVVLLGEHHDDADHHRWQLHSLAALHGHRPDMVLGFEMFPRRVQPVLDRWTAGELSEGAFLDQVGWQQVWGGDADLYMPLFQFARLQRLPMVALNVERRLVSKVAREGWDAVPEAEREGVGTAADPPEAYRHYLAEVFAMKHRHGAGAAGETGPQPAEAATVMDDPAFERFVQAQSTWDRAMAEALAAAAAARPDGTRPLVVGILGLGHVKHRWGVPHQLADLGLGRSEVAVLIPWPVQLLDDLPADLADAVFLLPEPPHR
ncbi:MAG: hypothetical protein EA406_02430 [Rhodospirillales bacterium]|nr:MAG: hypothetical protein EA406_02430 [Rhodospirillales bacterium]